MNRYQINILLVGVWLTFLLGTHFQVYAQYCVEGICNANAYLNSSDPNTIEYDNMVSSFHATLVREYDGKVRVWGQGIGQSGANIAPPIELNGTNYGTGANKLTGAVLRFAIGGAHQFAVLTTEGLYIWGVSGQLVPTNIPNVANNSFRKVSIGSYNVNGGAPKADGLPDGVQPTAVKMMFGTNSGLAIVTCDGQAWVLASNGDAYGDGAIQTLQNNSLWHRVSTEPGVPLEDVVAVRGAFNSFMALTSQGKIYTWGLVTRLGNNTAAVGRKFATLMSLPVGVIPKMIGMTSSNIGRTYYLLATDGRLFSLGDNAMQQLGDGGTVARNGWYQVITSKVVGGVTYSIRDNIAWISPQEHFASSASINVLTNEGKLWAWGNNSGGMLGSTLAIMPPTFMPGSSTGAYNPKQLNVSDHLMAVESGGHTSLVIKQCAARFGYVGHQTAGSMSDNITANGSFSQYTFGNTSEVHICGAISLPVLSDGKMCPGATFDLANAEPSAGVFGIDWWMDANATIPVEEPGSVPAGTYYGTYQGLSVKCPTPMKVSYYTAKDPEFALCESNFISNPLVRQLMQNAADATEKRDQFISR
ncbi:hypothetical protein [Myroides odoratus]|uniref:hypothetical protein n=1 Tax=Myroides odoratus TaxID=256 RepID=UPI00333EA7B3